MHILYPFAKRFIAGEDLQTALKSIDHLYNSGFLSTVDVLGENVYRADQALRAKLAYLDLLDHVRESSHPMDFSVKLTQMGLDIDLALCESNIEEIIEGAGTNTVRFDIEGSRHTQPILDMCLKMHFRHKNLGQALQAYLYRTGKDVDTMIDAGVSVRLCKGAYKEPPDIAYQDMDDICENFLKHTYKLIKNGFQPAIATHDEYLLTEILSFVHRENIDQRSFYFEMLYGVRRDLQKILLDKGYQVRIYVPYGKSWLPYTLRRLTEKKENILFVMKNLFRETFGIRKLHLSNPILRMTDPQPSTQNLKIALLTTSFPRFEGDYAGNFVLKFAQGLKKSGCDINAVVPHDPETDFSENWTGFPVKQFKYFPSNWQSLTYGAGMIGRIRKNPLRLLQFPFLCISYLYAALREARRSQVIQTFWSVSALVAIAVKFMRKTPVVSRLWGSDILFTKTPFLSRIFAKLMMQTDAIVCENHQFKEELKRIGVPDEKISVIPNGINLESFHPSDKYKARKVLKIPSNKTVILSVGSLSPIKGQDYLIRAIPELTADRNDIELILVGDGEWRSSLVSLIEELNLELYVTLTGFQHEHTIPTWLNTADIFVLPSLSEGTPNILLEAMACGLPIIASHVGGIPGIIKNGENGILIEPRSSEGLTEYLRLLIREKNMCERMGNMARKTVAEQFGDWDSQAVQLKELYTKILSEKKNR